MLTPEREIVYNKEVIESVTSSLSEFGQVVLVTQTRKGLMLKFGTCTKLKELVKKTTVMIDDMNWTVGAPTTSVSSTLKEEMILLSFQKPPPKPVAVHPPIEKKKGPPPRPSAPPPRPAPPPQRPAPAPAVERPAPPSRPAPPPARPAPPARLVLH